MDKMVRAGNPQELAPWVTEYMWMRVVSSMYHAGFKEIGAEEDFLLFVEGLATSFIVVQMRKYIDPNHQDRYLETYLEFLYVNLAIPDNKKGKVLENIRQRAKNRMRTMLNGPTKKTRLLG